MKTRKIWLLLLVVAVLVTISGSIHSDARASAPVPNALSGGQYLLTIQTPAVTPSSGYRLQDATAPTVDPAPGCCCKSHLPCMVK